MAAYRWFMTHVTCRLTAKNWDQLRNPKLGNRVWATFYTLLTYLLTDGRTDGRTSDIYINPAPHSISVNSLAEKITLWLSRSSEQAQGAALQLNYGQQNLGKTV